MKEPTDILKPMTFEDWDSGNAEMTDDYYTAVYGMKRNHLGIPQAYIVAYRGTTTGQLIGDWFSEVAE